MLCDLKMTNHDKGANILTQVVIVKAISLIFFETINIIVDETVKIIKKSLKEKL